MSRYEFSATQTRLTAHETMLNEKKNIAYECSCLLDLVLYLLSWSKSIDVFVGIEIIVVSCTHCDNNNDDGLILTKEKKS